MYVSVSQTNVYNCQTIPEPLYAGPPSDIISPYPLHFSPILQIDGNDSPPPDPTPSLHGLPSLSLPTPVPTSSVPAFRMRAASYTLDRSKQLKKLVRDTKNNDFTIVVNSNEENVNITCNTGFYATVAVPSLEKLAASQDFVCQGIDIHCRDIVGNFDATRAQQNTVVYFRLSKNKTSLGGVRIHLHHTSRMVQLQGGALSPGGMTAPVWFVKNILQQHFTQLSQEKSIDISKFNKAVQNMVSSTSINSSPQVCAGCNAQFNGRSSPEFCTECRSSYHKYKCYPTSLHTCYQKRRSQSHSNVPGLSTIPAGQPVSVVASPTTGPHQPLAPVPRNQPQTSLATGAASGEIDCSDSTTTSETPAGTGSCTRSSPQSRLSSSTAAIHGSPPTPNNELVYAPPYSSNVTHTSAVPGQTDDPHDHLVTPLLPLTQLHHAPSLDDQLPGAELGDADPPASQNEGIPDTQVQGTSTGLNPNALSFVSNSNAILVRAQVQSQRRTKANKKNNTVTADAISIQREFDKIEISTLQTKLQKLEEENKDLKFRNSIREE